MFVIDRDRLTCAGGTSVVHLASHLIEKHCGRAQALKSLRIMIEQQSLPAGAWQQEEIVTRTSQDSLVKRAMLAIRSEEQTSELQEQMRISYVVYCLKKNRTTKMNHRV